MDDRELQLIRARERALLTDALVASEEVKLGRLMAEGKSIWAKDFILRRLEDALLVERDELLGLESHDAVQPPAESD
jgi:hypothetical protein